MKLPSIVYYAFRVTSKLTTVGTHSRTVIKSNFNETMNVVPRIYYAKFVPQVRIKRTNF